ncbi:Conjugative transposon protein TraO [Mariniphaga anaerophila]|uniref:Conjugative transposon protein TraO n=1 Tax=Mariniphaga anaerophila TaxID=1484053 RepID=A0A1M4TXR6_9BACT|nr:conjugal transfer protein TraO [Mariniphaga anaerophila]SHE49222.1 Conjugative transposon protein TraO [Mariniphaga anaerophila]
MRAAVIIIAVAVCFVLSDEAHAQRALPGMQGLQITGGMVDGIWSKDNRNESGYYFGVAMATYGKNANKWVFGTEYLRRNYPYEYGRIPVEQITGEGGFFYNFLSSPGKAVCFSIGISALAGFETVNRGDKLLDDGATLRNENGFLYGGALTLEMESYITDRVVLLLTGRERMLQGTTMGHFHAQFGIGLKFIIN